jgi:hypothetical protein
MSTPLNAAWENSIAELLEASGTAALALRDTLAAQDREGLVVSLGTALLSKSTAPGKRILAGWLLKDLASPLAAPFFAEAFCAPFATSELQCEILDALERTAFGGDLPQIDVTLLRRCLRDQKPLRRFMDLLASLGTDQAQAVLTDLALDPANRATLVSDLASRPEPWVDRFLEHLRSTIGHDPAVEQALGERTRRDASLRARECSPQTPAGLAIVRPLWESGQFGTLLRLAEQGALSREALGFISSTPSPDTLSKAQRKLLTRLKSVVNPSHGL